MQKAFSRLQPAIGLLGPPLTSFLGPKCRNTVIARLELAELSFQRISYNALRYSSYHKCISIERIKTVNLELTQLDKIGFCECGAFLYTHSFNKISSAGSNIRYFSNDPRNSQVEKAEKKEFRGEPQTQPNKTEDDKRNVGRFGRFRAMVTAFFEGCKQLLWIDARKAWATKKKLKRHDYDLTILTREELRHMRQVLISFTCIFFI